ncbi:hypothetical protein ABZ705_20755 [Streptomyces sp. NPDC006984]|uniref:hypothetical protein n=1 Tax=Streptomyces sp. NPDC006984 TaxID=3155463 RepID=UPI003403C4B9
MEGDEQSGNSPDGRDWIAEATEKLKKYKFELKERSGDVVGYSRSDSRSDGFHDLSCLPEDSFVALESQLQSTIVPLREYFGFSSPSVGYFELPVRRISTISRSFAFDPILKGLPVEVPGECVHLNGSPMPCVEPPQESRRSPVRSVGKIHVVDPKGVGCLEVSWASPCGVLWGISNGRNSDFRYGSTPVRSFLSLKIALADPGDVATFEERCIDLANSFLYELSVRNGISLEPMRFAEYARPARFRRGPMRDSVRFPETRIKPEVAELFSFALGARANPSLSFLSYYQILEYFFPYAVRREAMRKVRKEISDPRFSKSEDSAILKILSAAEAVTNASESKQIATLIADSVRLDVLVDFFSGDAWGGHFGNSGPISSVGSINLKNASKPLPVQVAERVYKIRNRIVHAKDDPKYADVKVLLPKSKEAYALGPDIELLKVLAEEVVVDAQT